MDSRSLNEKASQETFISLLHLDPSPMDSPNADNEKDLPPLPEEPSESSTASLKSSGTATSVGLSGTGHGAIYYLLRIQRYSSYTLTLFTTLHLVTTSVIPLATRSVPASESYLLLAREIYQTPLSEPLLVALPALAHVASGFALRLIRRSHNLRRYGGATPGVHARDHRRRAHIAFAWPPLSYISLSGYALAVAVGAHAFVNRALPLAIEGDSSNVGLAYVAHGFARHPVTAWVAYVGLIGAASGHIVWGWARWLGAAQAAGWYPGAPTGNAVLDGKVRRRRRRVWLSIHGVAVGLAGLWAAGGLGVVGRGGLQLGWVGDIYDGLYNTIPGL